MNEIVTHLVEFQFSRGISHIFLYTKCESARFFGDLGFYPVCSVENQLVFMENKRTGFQNYLCSLQSETAASAAANISPKSRIAAVVMNANPFTLGHKYLVEKACAQNDLVHLFILSEDASLVPFDVRRQLVMAGTAHLDNICYHDSGPYIISNSTFPSYFQKDEHSVIEGHALLDLSVFCKIADALQITRRYVGEEPSSVVTGIYNQIMAQRLPEHGIDCTIIPRKTLYDTAISASSVRLAIQNHDLESLARLVPKTTFDYFTSPDAAPVVARIQAAGNVIHY